jgi:hypothetical protein
MLMALLRIAVLVGGIAFLLDAFLPTRVESLKVDLHTSRIIYNHHHQIWMNNHIGDTKYTLDFVGGRMSSCEVGYAAYSKLHDGDAVEIQETRILKKCIIISKDGEVIESNKFLKYIEILIGCVLIAFGMGWLKADNDKDFFFF